MDSKYLQDHVGPALSLALAELVQKQPLDPIDFLAGWLRKYVQIQNEKIKDKEEQFLLQKEIEAADADRRRNEAMLEEQNAIAHQVAAKEARRASLMSYALSEGNERPAGVPNLKTVVEDSEYSSAPEPVSGQLEGEGRLSNEGASGNTTSANIAHHPQITLSVAESIEEEGSQFDADPAHGVDTIVENDEGEVQALRADAAGSPLNDRMFDEAED